MNHILLLITFISLSVFVIYCMKPVKVENMRISAQDPFLKGHQDMNDMNDELEYQVGFNNDITDHIFTEYFDDTNINDSYDNSIDNISYPFAESSMQHNAWTHNTLSNHYEKPKCAPRREGEVVCTKKAHNDFFTFRDKTEHNSSMRMDPVDKITNLYLTDNTDIAHAYGNAPISQIFDSLTAGPNFSCNGPV